MAAKTRKPAARATHPPVKRKPATRRPQPAPIDSGAAGFLDNATPWTPPPPPLVSAGQMPGAPTPGSAARAAKRQPPAGQAGGPQKAKPRPRPPVKTPPTAGAIPSVAPKVGRKSKAAPKAAHHATRPKR